MNVLIRLAIEDGGQDLIEYSLLAALIAVGSIAVMNLVGDELDAIFGRIITELQNAPG